MGSASLSKDVRPHRCREVDVHRWETLLDGESDKDVESYDAESRSWGLLNKNAGDLEKALRADYKA